MIESLIFSKKFSSKFRKYRMPKDQSQPPKFRQKPVSRTFRRTRKLRCSRTAPCSNCILRGITCDLEPPHPQPIVVPETSGNSEIIERLHRLVSLLLAQKEEVQGRNAQCPESSESQYQSTSSSQFQDIDMGSDATHFDSTMFHTVSLSLLLGSSKAVL